MSLDTHQLTSHSSAGITSQPISKLFWRYALPAVLGMVIQGIYYLVDGIFIGHAVGAEGLAAVHLGWPIFAGTIGLGLMLGVGASALYSIDKGAGQIDKARQVLGNVFILLPLLSIPLAWLVYKFGPWGIVFQSASDQALRYGTEYLQILALGSFPAMASAALPMLIRNDEQPALATSLVCISAGVNIILDWLLVVIIGLGVAGAAIATVIAETAITLFGIAHFFSNRANDRIHLNHLTLKFRLSIKTMNTGLSSLMLFLYFSFVLVIHNRQFMAYGDTVALAAFAIIGYVQSICYMFAEGIGHGMQPLISYNKGAGNHQNIYDTLMLASKVVFGICLTMQMLLFLFPEAIAKIFTSDQTLVQMTTTGIRLHLFTLCLDGFIMIAACYFQALAKARLATLISMGNILIQIPLLYLLPRWMDVTGVWIAMPVSNLFLALVVIWLVVRELNSYLKPNDY